MTISQSFFNFFGICQVPNGSKFIWLPYECGHIVNRTHMTGLVVTDHGYVKNHEKFTKLLISQKYGKTPLQIFLFSKSSYLYGFRPKKTGKKLYLFFATVRQSWYGPILTYLPLISRSSPQTQPSGSVRVAYEN